ncbi:DUF2868 domain-containing protein [Ideonella sp. YS5]
MGRSRWLDAIVVRTVRSVDQASGLADEQEAVQAGARASGGARERIVAWAWARAGRLGLTDEIERWRSLLPWLVGGAAVGVGLLSVPLLKSVIGHDRHINLLGALAAVLALPTLSLLLWCGSLMMGRGHAGGGLARGVVSLSMRLPGLRTRHSPHLWAAAIETLREAGLGLWALGALNHGFWILAFSGILMGLLASFAFWSYTLGWETTILSPGFFASVVQAIGWLPASLGFPLIDPGLANSTAAAGDQASRAWWLIGCTLVYGLLPRLVALAGCAIVAWRRWPALGQADIESAAGRELAERMARIAASAAIGALQTRTDGPRVPLALLGFELPADTAWPPQPLGEPLPTGAWSRAIAGTAEERRACIEQALATRPHRLLVACRAAATPDRGTERFLQALFAPAGQGALWLQGEHEHPAWQAWLQASALRGLAVVRDGDSARAWLAGRGHD